MNGVVSVGLEQLQTALDKLPTGLGVAGLLRASVRVCCEELGCAQAAVWQKEAPEPLVHWPEEGPYVRSPGEQQVKLGEEFALAVLGGVPEAAQFGLFVGRLLEEAHVAEQRLAEAGRRERALAERHRELIMRTEELYQELDAQGRRQLLLGERNRIAQDLHDRAAQNLFLINLKAQWLLDHLDASSPLRAEVERVGELATQGAAQMREAIYALRAKELAEGGLPEGLSELVHGLEKDGLAASLTVTGYRVTLPPEVEDALFKVAQEAISNTRKHSCAGTVVVALRYGADGVTLVVQDDGAGLEPGAEAKGGLGLAGMRRRVEELGGALTLVTDDEGGLIVRATIPMTRR